MEFEVRTSAAIVHIWRFKERCSLHQTPYLMASINTSIVTTNHHSGPSKTDLELDISELVLSSLTSAAKLSTIPYLQDAAQLALGIVTIIQVPHYFSISSPSLTNHEREDLGCQESQRIVQTIGE